MAPHFPRARPPRLDVREIKTLVRHRDGYRCQECGMTARRHVKRHGTNLQVHRLVPGSRYTVRGCVTLCIGCHKSKPKSAPGTGVCLRPDGKVRLGFILPHDLLAVIRAHLATTRPRLTFTAFVEFVLENHLRQVGFPVEPDA